MRRRDLGHFFAGVVLWPHIARAQQAAIRPRKIGVLWHAASAQEESIYLGALRDGLADIGWIEGKNYSLENRFPAEQYERFFTMANELAALNVDVFIAVTRVAALAAQRATQTIPIIFVVVPDPIESKLVSSLAKPGGNITGLSNMAVELSAKRMEIFREAVGNLERVAVLVNPNDPQFVRRYLETTQSAAGAAVLAVFEAKAPTDLDGAFNAMIAARMNGVVIAVDPMFYNERDRIAALALKHQLPTIAYNGEYVDAGLLMSYGPDYINVFHRVAYYVQRIVGGTPPAELPVEQPTKFQLTLNSRTAKALGIEFPTTLALSATKLIE
jgi:putative tryptophan/tyrosine transport system substrate-binding protein